MKIPHFHVFKTEIEGIVRPEKFTFPFYYTPHTLAGIAVKEVQFNLSLPSFLEHNFGFSVSRFMAQGKMFGVLVVENQQHQLGYLVAYSGKLNGNEPANYFVPPVFDTHRPDGFYKNGEKELNLLNERIEAMENNVDFLSLQEELKIYLQTSENELTTHKNQIAKNKEKRNELRIALFTSNDAKSEEKLKELDEESKREQLFLKHLKRTINEQKTTLEAKISQHLENISSLKSLRGSLSKSLQEQIFCQYTFLNKNKKERSLLSIFEQTVFKTPPSGAGECAAPKLLQYAFLNDLSPICMAEFWWGKSPESEVRVHQQFYPACRGKCEPILGHMLTGIPLDPNPIIAERSFPEIEILYEDSEIVVVNKPEGVLSVPGKSDLKSVQTWLENRSKEEEKTTLVHRLDMGTSGILLAAKNPDAYKKLQIQFIKRKVKKEYIAILEKEIQSNKGEIDFPLCLDINDRPKQMVDYESGKPALTHFHVLEKRDGKTRILFQPHTGRTHQLRVHAAHKNGLNAPIMGDDLYGNKADRLYLHAAYLKFRHPSSNEIIEIRCNPSF